MICLTPVRNESWVLDLFLRCASLWADHIIIADQGSTDGSCEIARRHPKVRLIENPSADFNEPERQALLIEEARRIPGPRFLVALDADEILSANTLTSDEWDHALKMPPGSVIGFPRIDLYHSPEQYFFSSVEDAHFWAPLGYVDDEAEHVGAQIHSFRVPMPDNSPRLNLKDVFFLHYQFCDLSRAASKHRWYRCFERVHFPEKSPGKIHRIYDWMERIGTPIRPSLSEWFAAYQAHGIDTGLVGRSELFWWDWEVLRLFAEHGPEFFRGIDIWSVNWEAMRRRGLELGIERLPDYPIQDPRRLQHRLGMMLLRRFTSRAGRRVGEPLADLLLGS